MYNQKKWTERNNVYHVVCPEPETGSNRDKHEDNTRENDKRHKKKRVNYDEIESFCERNIIVRQFART